MQAKQMELRNTYIPDRAFLASKKRQNNLYDLLCANPIWEQNFFGIFCFGRLFSFCVFAKVWTLLGK